MSTKIKVVAVVASAAALTGGIAAGANASTRITKTTTITRTAMAAPNGINGVADKVARGPQQMLASVLADLVKKGTITQSQADAIAAAAEAARPAMPMDPRDGGFGGAAQAKLDLIAKTIGVDTATILTRIKAGDSLATIAGDKKAALISALVAEETKHIDAAVTAGKLTATQATSMKANLTAHITAMVEASPARIGRGMGDMRGGMKGGRFGHGPMMGNAPALPGAAPTSKS